MSIGRMSANFSQLKIEKEGESIFSATLKKGELEKMQKEDQERLQNENKKFNRKQKLIYDLEVDSKIRKI